VPDCYVLSDAKLKVTSAAGVPSGLAMSSGQFSGSCPAGSRLTCCQQGEVIELCFFNACQLLSGSFQDLPAVHKPAIGGPAFSMIAQDNNSCTINPPVAVVLTPSPAE